MERVCSLHHRGNIDSGAGSPPERRRREPCRRLSDANRDCSITVDEFPTAVETLYYFVMRRALILIKLITGENAFLAVTGQGGRIIWKDWKQML